MRQPIIDRTRPPTKVELRQQWLEHRFQRRENLADFFVGVACNPAERLEGTLVGDAIVTMLALVGLRFP